MALWLEGVAWGRDPVLSLWLFNTLYRMEKFQLSVSKNGDRNEDYSPRSPPSLHHPTQTPCLFGLASRGI